MKRAGLLVRLLVGFLISSNVHSSESSLVDLSFHPPDLAAIVTSSFNHIDNYSGALREDGSLVIAVNLASEVTGLVGGQIISLKGDGTLEDQFAPVDYTSGGVMTLETLPNGRILIGGYNMELFGAASTPFARLFAVGSVDNSFSVSAPLRANYWRIESIKADAAGRIYAMGTFAVSNQVFAINFARFLPTGAFDPTFQPITGNLTGFQLLSGGKILVCGDLDENPNGTNKVIARYDESGIEDSGFTPPVALGLVTAMAVQPDKKILIAEQNHLIRLQPDGAIDLSFQNDYRLPILSQIVPRSDGRILVTGGFSDVNGFARQGIAQFLTNGILDPEFIIDFEPRPKAIQILAQQTDGKIIVGGSFTNVNGFPATNLVRLNDIPFSDTTSLAIDSQMDFSENTNYALISVLRAGNLSLPVSVRVSTSDDTAKSGIHYVGISTNVIFHPGERAVLVSVPIINNLILDGSRVFNVTLSDSDPANVLPAGAITRTATIHDDEIQVGFVDTSMVVSEIVRYAKINFRVLSFDSFVHGPLDHFELSYKTIMKSAVPDVDYASSNHSGIFRYDYSNQSFYEEIYDNRKYDAGREFDVQLIGSPGIVIGQYSTMTVQINDNDNLAGFAQGANGPIYSSAVQPDGKVLMGGDFTRFDGLKQNFITRLLPDGSVDDEFNGEAGLNGSVDAIAVDSSGKIVVAGEFTSVNGKNASHIARLNSDGSVDSTFDAGEGWTEPAGSPHIWSLAVGSNNDIYTSSVYLKFNGKERLGGLARLTARGELDEAFIPPLSRVQDSEKGIHKIFVQKDGNILVGGSFVLTPPGSTELPSALVRLTPGGTLDHDFALTNSGLVTLVTELADKKILAYDATQQQFFRWLPNGNVDSSFARTALPGILDFLVLNDGRVMAASELYQLYLVGINGGMLPYKAINNFPRSVSTLAQLLDGKVMIASDAPNQSGYYGVDIVDTNAMPITTLRFLLPVMSQYGQMNLAFRGQIDKPYVIQRSRDLRLWTTILSVDTRFQNPYPRFYIDPEHFQSGHVYYRIRVSQ